MDQALGDDAILVADGGDFVATASYILRPRAPLAWLDPGAFGTLGVGAGFALGAATHRAGARSGSYSATAHADSGWPSSTPSCATELR